ncbi:MAG TPA: MFS transporter [Polyangia bacterium]
MNTPARVGFLLLAVAWGANHFVPLLPVYRLALGLSATEIAQIFGVYAVGLVPGLLLGGPLSDRWGRVRLVLPAALVALMGSLVLGSFAAGFAQLLLGRFVVGLGSGAVFSAATAWVQDLAAASGPPGVGARRAAIALSLGFGGGPLVAGLLAQWGPWPLRLPYGVQSVVLIGAWAAVAAAAPSASGPAQVSGTSMLPRSLHAPAPRVRVWPLPVGFGRQILPAAPWVFALPSISFAVLPAGLAATIGRHAAVFAGTVAAFTLLSGVLVQTPLRTRDSIVAARFGLTCGAAGLALAAVALNARSIAGVLGAAVVLGAGYGGCLVAGLRFIESRSPPPVRGAHTGIFYVLAYAGFVAPLLLAWLGERWGTAGAVGWASACAGGSLLLLVLLKPRGAG